MWPVSLDALLCSVSRWPTSHESSGKEATPKVTEGALPSHLPVSMEILIDSSTASQPLASTPANPIPQLALVNILK